MINSLFISRGLNKENSLGKQWALVSDFVNLQPVKKCCHGNEIMVCCDVVTHSGHHFSVNVESQALRKRNRTLREGLCNLALLSITHTRFKISIYRIIRPVEEAPSRCALLHEWPFFVT